jgi:hypothetical protein
MTEPSLQRRFCVHDIHEASNRAHLVEGLTFEDAALHFVADHHPSADDDEVSLYVEDLETGERQCLRIDVPSWRAEPCD